MKQTLSLFSLAGLGALLTFFMVRQPYQLETNHKHANPFPVSFYQPETQSLSRPVKPPPMVMVSVARIRPTFNPSFKTSDGSNVQWMTEPQY